MIVQYDEEAIQDVLKGAEKLYKAVKTTFGPKGRNVLVHHLNNIPVVTHDGVTVAEAFRNLPQSTENSGIALIKSAAQKMNQIGDGTTTVTILAYHLLVEANKLLAAGHNAMDLKRELDEAVGIVLAEIDKIVETVEGEEKLAEVVSISAGDSELGKLIAGVITEVGPNGIVSVEKSDGTEIETEVTTGFVVDYGYESPHMATDPVKGNAVYANPHVLVVKGKLNSIVETLPVLEKIANSGKKEVLILSEGLEGEALANTVLNKIKGNLNVVSVGIPIYQRDILEDIAQITQATVISVEAGVRLKDADLSHLGKCSKVIVDNARMTIIGGEGDVSTKAESLKNTIISSKDKAEVKTAKQRLARLTGSVGVIRVGGATETEIEERKYRIDDAVAAGLSAVRGGIVPGGGVTYINAVKNSVMKFGGMVAPLLVKALEQPTRILLENAGFTADELLSKIREAEPGQGVNVRQGKDIVDLKSAGVVDPAEVTKQALKTASSIAGNVLTLGAAVIEEGDTNESHGHSIQL